MKFDLVPDFFEISDHILVGVAFFLGHPVYYTSKTVWLLSILKI